MNFVKIIAILAHCLLLECIVPCKFCDLSCDNKNYTKNIFGATQPL